MVLKEDFATILLTELKAIENRLMEKIEAGMVCTPFEDEPIFNMGPLFDAEPIFDERLVFDAAPIYDVEPNDFSTAGCGVTLFDDLDISTAMGDHNTTVSPRQALTTSSIDKEFVPDSFRAAEALATMVVVPSNVNTDAPTTCSTKC
ncbi:hypothetical protein PR202_ga00226 [Eleusine coracana subsp. coracana]|uniref:Reverse transcriptase domain-containing protein n=1 Tax=Eleusine coracana subsp. coracana TaxID=191504 RepID=A0AAV5BFZ6_ELECO|nr:hypothetical protein PR202_ga00226 [Eleusine coracana subsp. coracana]